MARKKTKRRGESGASTSTVISLRLYIANNAPNSIRAIANLEAICEEYLDDTFTLEIIDVLEYPQRALADGIVVTPSLTKSSPLPVAKVVGNLSDKSSVLHALGVAKRP